MRLMDIVDPLFEGRLLVIEYARLEDGETRPAKTYFEGLDAKDQIRFLPSFRKLDSNPSWSCRYKFKMVEGEKNLWVFKAGQQRMYAAWAGKNNEGKRRLIAVCGIPTPKKQQRARPENIARAVRIRDVHFKYWERWESKP